MIGRKAAVGLSLLCALVFCAFVAQSASAAIGTTAYTCIPDSEHELPGFKDAHCAEPAKTAPEVNFKHKAIKQDEKTIVHGTNEKTSADTKSATAMTLKSTLNKEPAEITCEKVFAHGGLVNRIDTEVKDHYIEGEAGITILYTGCKFLKPGTCKLKEEKIEVTGVRANTLEQGHNVSFEPPEGSKVFVTLSVENCFGITKIPIEAFALWGQVKGATIEFSEAETTKDKSLKFNKELAGLEGKITISQAEKTEESGKTGNAISATTQ